MGVLNGCGRAVGSGTARRCRQLHRNAFKVFNCGFRAPAGMNYLLVTLRVGESWTYVPPNGHESLWLSVSRGSLGAPNLVNAGEMVIFEPGSGAVTLKALHKDAVFVIGSAEPHPYDLALGCYSVHTNPHALRAGEEKIAEIGVRLREYLQKPDKSGTVPVFR